MEARKRLMQTVRRDCEADSTVAPPEGSSPPAPPLIEVSWTDIISDSSWTPPEDVECPEFRTVGWLVYEDDKCIKIADTMDAEGNPWGITAFPVGCSLERILLKS